MTKIKVWEIPEGWRILDSNPWAKYESISRIMLKNCSEIEIAPGTYTEMVHERTGSEVYLGIDALTNANVIGNAKEIICQWFVDTPQSKEIPASTI